MCLSHELSCEAGSFPHCSLNPPQVFSVSGLRLYFPMLELWVVQSVTQSTSCSFAHPAPQSATSLGPPTAVSPLCPGCPSPPLLLVWRNVFSLSPWLSDFCVVLFSVSSGCFLFLNCCCPSFGCARRHSVSTYASILAGSPRVCFSEPI